MKIKFLSHSSSLIQPVKMEYGRNFTILGLKMMGENKTFGKIESVNKYFLF